MSDGDRSPTREQLLEVRRQAQLVHYGKGLLEKKRDALLRAIEEERREFKRVEAEFKKRLSTLWQAYGRLQLSEGETGIGLMRPSPLRQLAVSRRSLMGRRFPVFEPTPESAFTPPSYDPALSSVYTDELVEELEELDKLLWGYLNGKAKLQALENELSRTLVKINTLEHTLLPELGRDERRIQDVLSERERQERYSLKSLMKKLKSDG
jgi:V/A-type H+-transporting ATPase subunit D